MMAGGVVCAQSLGMKVKAIDVGYSRLAAASVARKAIYDREPVGHERLIISFGESLALAMAAGLPVADQIGDDSEGPTNKLFNAAATAITAFGKEQFIELVDALETMRRFGVYKLGKS